MRNLQQNSRAITRVDFATFGAAMLQIDENLKRLPDNLIRFAADHIDDKADTATVVFKLRIVQDLVLAAVLRTYTAIPLRTTRPVKGVDYFSQFR